MHAVAQPMSEPMSGPGARIWVGILNASGAHSLSRKRPDKRANRAARSRVKVQIGRLACRHRVPLDPAEGKSAASSDMTAMAPEGEGFFCDAATRFADAEPVS